MGFFTLRNALAFAGAIPFMASAVLLFTGHTSHPILGDVSFAITAYAIIIATFMSGAHWGQHLHLQSPWNTALSIISNIITVTLWFAFITQPTALVVLHVIVALVSQLVIDALLFKHRIIDQPYFLTRCIVTSIVCASLVCIWSMI